MWKHFVSMLIVWKYVTVLNSYNLVAIRKAKHIFWAECCTKQEELNLEKIHHRDTSNRTQAEADLDDILDAMEKLNGWQVLPNFYYKANDLLYLPPAVPACLVSVEIMQVFFLEM